MIVFGKTGQVATELQALLPDATFLERSQADLSVPQQCFDVIMAAKPSAVINAAAYTAVDKAEVEEALATLINGEAPTQMAKACAALDIPFVQISTDYVFDGAGEAAMSVAHPTAPLGAYGRSKLVGEQGVSNAAGRYAILRTSWVFSAHGNNFVKTMLRLAETRESLNVVADQIGGPTSARAIARACVEIAEQLKRDAAKSGVYHFAGAPDTSWAGFARAIFDRSGHKVDVSDIPTSAYPTPARRPANSRLDCETTTETFGIARPDWTADLADVLFDLKVLK